MLLSRVFVGWWTLGVCLALSCVFCVALHWCLLTLSGGDVTHCHIVSLRRSPSSHTIKKVGGGDLSLLSVALIYPNICPSSRYISVHARLRYLDEVQRRRVLSLCPCLSVDGAITWEPVAILSLWCCSPSPPRERERERPGALQSFSVLIFITAKAHCFQSAPMPQHPCDLHCALFRYDIGTFVLLCRRLDSQLTGSK